MNKETEIVKLLSTHGPLVVAVDAKSWQHYLGGVIQYHCDNDLNHAAQVVGYDLTGISKEYIFQNRLISIDLKTMIIRRYSLLYCAQHLGHNFWNRWLSTHRNRSGLMRYRRRSFCIRCNDILKSNFIVSINFN